MRKLLVISICLALTFAATAQKPDPGLMKRLNEYMKYNRELNFAKMMDYVHPRLFTLAPKDVLISTFEDAFDNVMMRMDFDSMSIVKIGDEFRVGDTAYRKVDYYMEARMMMKDSSTYNSPDFVMMMTEGLEDGFPGAKISYDSVKHEFSIKGNDILFAIKDKPTMEWFFLGFDDNEEQMVILFPEAVIQHFKLRD